MPQLPEASKLLQILESLRTDVDKIKESNSSPQLGSSSVDVFQGRGFIPIMENGVEKHRIGRQPDGTITSVSKNNTDPPATPKAPVCTPFIGGVTVLCEGFLQKQYLDFSHIRVYVDDQLTDCIMKVPGAVAITPLEPGPHTFYLKSVNLSNTASPSSEIVISSPNLVVGADITDGIVSTLKLANDAVTEAKLAAGSVDNEKLVANAVQALNIAAEAVNADKIAANAVTAEKIQALAVVADKIAANAVTAGKIQAGSVTAEKLAATIILAGTAIIVGNPLLARLVLDATGLTQVDQYGNISMQIGSSPSMGNYLTIIDPTDPGNALATIGRDGSITVGGINITGTAYLNGIDLVGFLNNQPQGMIAIGTFLGTYSAGTSSEVGMFEIQFQTIAGRAYQIQSDTFTCYGTYGVSYIRYTLNGTVPTINSTILSRTNVAAGDYQRGGGSTSYDTNPPGSGAANTYANHNHAYVNPTTYSSHNVTVSATSTAVMRILVTISISPLPPGGGPNVYDTYAPVYLATSGGKFSVWVNDLGINPISTGGSSSGGGSSNANGSFTRTFTPTYTKYGTATGALQNGLQQGKAGSTDYVSMIGFDQSQLSTALDGGAATIDKCELYIYSNYWSVAEGGYICIGYHNAAGTPTTYSFMVQDWVQAKMKKPQGLWITLPGVAATSLANGYIKGFVLDCRASYPAATNYGIFRELTYTDATVRPSLRVTFRK